MLQEEKQQELFQTYVCQNLWAINSIQHARIGVKNDMQQYVELIRPETQTKKLTAEEIKQRTLEMLR